MPVPKLLVIVGISFFVGIWIRTGLAAVDLNRLPPDSVFACMNPDEIDDALSGARKRDLANVLQSCMDKAGRRALHWPSAHYLISHQLVPPAGQVEIGEAAADNSGTIIELAPGMDAPAFLFKADGTIRGFAFRGSATNSTPNQHCVHVDNANQVRIEQNFFANCYDGTYLNGTSFYITIQDNLYYSNLRRQLTIESNSDAGVDLVLRANRFLALEKTADSAIRFAGLGSIIASDNQMSVENQSGPLVWFERAAKLYGGAQMANNVFENGNETEGAAVYVQGTADAPWKELNFVNNFLTGGHGAALALEFASKPTWVGGAMSSVNKKGSIQFGRGSVVRDLTLNSVAFEGLAGVSPIQAESGARIGMSIVNPSWAGSAPLADFSALSARDIFRFDAIGGDLGTAPVPYVFPAGAPANVRSVR